MALCKLGRKVYCRKCKGQTNHGIISTHEETSEYTGSDFDWKYFYHTVNCLGCDTIAFVIEYGNETMLEFDMESESSIFFDHTVYPEEPRTEKISNNKTHVKKDFNESPEAIQIMYSQIVSAFNMESYLLAAVGLRMLVEGICKDLGIKEGYIQDDNGDKKMLKNSTDEVKSKSLEGKINGLVEKNVVIQKQANILHQIRELGNSSAHELQIPEKRTVVLAIDILEKILEQIYELHKYEIK